MKLLKFISTFLFLYGNELNAGAVVKQNFPIILSKSIVDQKSIIETDFKKAQQRVEDFADKHGWKSLVNESFIKKAHIFDSKPEFDKYIQELTGQSFNSNIPTSFSAALEKMEFIAVSPTVYLKIYPDANEPDSYEKLIAHEIIHRLHVRILSGNEDAMGPVWFYEGLAIYGADQFHGTAPNLSDKEIWAIVNSTERGNYRKYSSVMRFFLKKTSLQELIMHASKSDFIDWLASLK